MTGSERRDARVLLGAAVVLGIVAWTVPMPSWAQLGTLLAALACGVSAHVVYPSKGRHRG